MQDSSLKTRRSKSATNRPARRIGLPGVFVAFSLVFGLANAIVTPPFQVPDEPQHLLRAYQISEFKFLPTFHDGYGGGKLPTSIAFVCQPFGNVRYWGDVTSARVILTTLRIPLHPDQRAYYEFPNTAVYSPLGYVPQAIAVGIGRGLHLTTLALMYLARFANLLLWTACGYLALRLAAGIRRPMFLLMMMPMALFEAASASTDAMAVSIALLLAAMIWREAMKPAAERISGPALTSLLLLSVGLGLTKFVYLPLTGLLLLIPSGRFGGNWRQTAAFAGIAILGVATELLWSVHTPGLDAVLASDIGYHDFFPRGQLAFLRQHPAAWFSVPIQTLVRSWWPVAVSFVGNFGWMNAPVAGIFCVAYLAALILACGPTAHESTPGPLWKWTAVVIAVLASSLFTIGLAEYLYWNLVGSEIIRGLQGRYFIPIAPAALMLICVLWQRFGRKFWWGADRQQDIACAIFAAAGSAYALFVIYRRFYGM